MGSSPKAPPPPPPTPAPVRTEPDASAEASRRAGRKQGLATTMVDQQAPTGSMGAATTLGAPTKQIGQPFRYGGEA